jgi:hypothetical protein
MVAKATLHQLVETGMLQDGVHSNSRTTLPRQHPLQRIRASALIRSAAVVQSTFQTTISRSKEIVLKNPS